MIDREIQKNETFTGIRGVNAQDRAVQESMGLIVDRSREFLGPSDVAIVATRKLLEEAVNTVVDGGDPVGLGPSYYYIRSAQDTVPYHENWREVLIKRMYPA